MPNAKVSRSKIPKRKPWHVYLVRCSDGSIYTGISDNVEARVEKHNAGRGAKYTAQRRPVSLMYSEKLKDQGSAMKREAQIKKWGKQAKENLASGVSKSTRTKKKSKS